MPHKERATSMSWIIVEMMNWIASRMVFVADWLIPTLRWSQITSTKTILMINSVEIETSRILLAESGRCNFSVPFGESGAWGCLGIELDDAASVLENVHVDHASCAPDEFVQKPPRLGVQYLEVLSLPHMFWSVLIRIMHTPSPAILAGKQLGNGPLSITQCWITESCDQSWSVLLRVLSADQSTQCWITECWSELEVFTLPHVIHMDSSGLQWIPVALLSGQIGWYNAQSTGV